MLSPDNTLLATTSRESSHSVEIWHTSDGSKVSTISLDPLQDTWVEALAFTSDNQYLLVVPGILDDIEIYRLP